MNDKQIDELIDRLLKEDQTLPEGLSERLERHIDSFPKAGCHEKPKAKSLRRSLYWLSGSAAAVLVAAGLFWLTDSGQTSQMADTYTNPHEAAQAAQEALVFMSANLNKGICQVNDANLEVAKINKILNKHLKD